jgi:hypothetical protein
MIVSGTNPSIALLYNQLQTHKEDHSILSFTKSVYHAGQGGLRIISQGAGMQLVLEGAARGF